ncbi:hypothetical protein CPB85DRAFT_1361207 [Mucidula mucida]|nr:hypothetical protein CPB85DRAFT_1361207 [Mucidula mucida]
MFPSQPGAEAERTPLMMPGAHSDAAVQHVAFLIRPYDGMTRSLYELFAAKPSIDGSIPVKLYFEGPYGHEHHPTNYSAVVFIAGGVGLSFTLPYILHWDVSSDKQPRMRFAWTVRSYSEIDSAMDLLRSVDESLRTSVEVYYTGARDAWRDRIFLGRPRIEDMMTEALIADEETAGSAKARLGVFACGPGGMLDQCRSDVETLRAHTTACIDYIEEASTA